MEVFCHLGIGESLKVCQKENLPHGGGKPFERLLNFSVSLFVVQSRIRRRKIKFHEINDRGLVAVASDGGGHFHRLLSASLTQVVTTFVRCDGEQPGSKLPRTVESVGGDVNLEKGLLKDIFRGRAVTDQAGEESEQIVVVALDERTEGFGLAASVPFKELFVADVFKPGQTLLLSLGGLERYVAQGRQDRPPPHAIETGGGLSGLTTVATDQRGDDATIADGRG